MLLDYILKPFIQEGTLRIIDSDGTVHVYSGRRGMDVTIKLHTKQIERALLWQPTLALGEGYMNGSITVEKGTLYQLLGLCAKNLAYSTYRVGILQKLFLSLTTLIANIQQYNPIARAHRRIAHHYDLNEEFIKLFLDKDLQYSCAYFKNEQDSLETAQENKKLHIANKLLLKPGQRVLDIGSGWGGMALYLAKHADVEVVGLTLSKEQHALATERAKQMQLSDRVKFYLRDYREEMGKYDRIVSVGMFEHVGVPQYQIYFDQANRLLTDDGIMLLHSIGITGAPRPTNSWIRKYIFPGGHCPSLSEVLPTIEKSNLHITDIEILRYHYALTLMHWRERFMKNREVAKKIYGEQFCLMWEYYLASCEVAFRNQDLMVFQIQLVRDKSVIPITRDYLYETEENISKLNMRIV
jgi:cyclopropane-fatty-acyl-phospholipid synthase